MFSIFSDLTPDFSSLSIASPMQSKSILRLGTQLQRLSTKPAPSCVNTLSAARSTRSISSRSHCSVTCSSHSHFLSGHNRSFSSTKMSKENGHVQSKATGEKEDGHQHQAGNSTDRDIDQWKHREPYAIHDHDKNAKFDVKWEGSCHCGKVTYQLSRDKPLAAKYCHCTTCQRLHGVSDYAQSCSLH